MVVRSIATRVWLHLRLRYIALHAHLWNSKMCAALRSHLTLLSRIWVLHLGIGALSRMSCLHLRCIRRSLLTSSTLLANVWSVALLQCRLS